MRINEPITNRELLLNPEEPLVSRTDAGGRITFVYKAFIDISGFTEAELLGQPHSSKRFERTRCVAWDHIRIRKRGHQV